MMNKEQQLHRIVRVLDSVDQIGNPAGSRQILYYNERTGEYENEKPGLIVSLVAKYTAIEINKEQIVTLLLPSYQIPSLHVQLDIQCSFQLADNSELLAAEWIRKNQSPDSEVQKLLFNDVERYVEGHSSLKNENYHEYEEDLKKQLKSRMLSIGFSCKLTIEPIDKKALPHETYKLITAPVKCLIRDGEVIVICTLAVEMENPGKFAFANIPNLSNHFEKFLGHLLQSTFLKKSYAEVLQSFLDNSLQEELERPVSEEAYRIGYKVTNLFSIPQVEDFDGKGPFELSTDSSTDGIEFMTSAPLVKVRIKVVLRGYIRDFRGPIEHYLKPGVKLKTIMQKEMINRMQLYLGRVKPERFFLYFDQPDPETGGASLVEDLKGQIRKVLQDSFNFEILDVTITSHHTKLSAEFLRLQNMIGKIEISDFARLIHYRVNFAVSHVDPQSWHIFMIRLSNETAEYKMMAIGETLKDYFETKFNTEPRFRLIQGTHKHFPLLIKGIFQQAQKEIIAAHGVALQLIGMAPILTNAVQNSEDYLNEQQSNRYRDELESMFKENNSTGQDEPSSDKIVKGLLSDYNISPTDSNPQLNNGGSSTDDGEDDDNPEEVLV